MKAPPFEYHRASSLPETLSLLASVENAKVLAGGQSLVAMMNLRYVFPDHVIDINPLAELAGVSIADGVARIGAMTRQRAMETSDELYRVAPIFREALAVVGHRQTRNRGTFGGSLCHLDPSAELPTVALLYDADVHVASVRETRIVPMQEFILGYMTPAIEPDELVVAIDIKVWGPRHGSAFLEHARRHGDFAIASAGCLIEPDETGAVARVAICVGGLMNMPIRLPEAEAPLVGSRPSAEAFREAARACLDYDATADIHAERDYRRKVAATLVERALNRAWSRAAHVE